MRFTVDRATMLKALAHVQSVVEKRNTIPILANLMLAVREGRLSLTATDMEIAVVEEVAATTSQDGATTAPAVTLYEIVRRLPEGAEVELDYPGGDAPLKLKAGRYVTSLMVLPTEDFPAMTTGSLPHRFRLGGERAPRPDRPHPLRDQHGGDALLPERHLSPCDRERGRSGAARGGDRRAPAGAGGGAAAGGSVGHAGRDRAAQDGARAAQAPRGNERGGRDRAFRYADPVPRRAR